MVSIRKALHGQQTKHEGGAAWSASRRPSMVSIKKALHGQHEGGAARYITTYLP